MNEFVPRSLVGDGNLVPRQSQPPYRQYAFVNPYNATFLAIMTTTALATGQYWLIGLTVVLEAIWVLFAPKSKALRASIFDKLWGAAKEQEQKERLRQKFEQLSPLEQRRVLHFRKLIAQIEEGMANSLAVSGSKLQETKDQLKELLEDFLDRSLALKRYEEVFQMDAVSVLRNQLEFLENTLQVWAIKTINPQNWTEVRDRLEDLRTEVQVLREANQEIKSLPG